VAFFTPSKRYLKMLNGFIWRYKVHLIGTGRHMVNFEEILSVQRIADEIAYFLQQELGQIYDICEGLLPETG